MKKYFIRGINTMAIATLVLTVVFMTAFALYLANYSDYRLSDEELSFDTSSITEIYTMEFTDRAERMGTPSSEPFEELYASRRIWTPYEQFPRDLINAFIAIEDHRFYEHKGVDFARTAKAVLNYLFSFEERTFGGSTITQQLVKNVTGNNRVKIKRKIEEIFSAMDLERRYTKNDIMEMYLNIVYLSENTYGIGAASDAYFGKSPSELSLEECAALAAIVQNPSRYDPYLYPEANAERRKLVLAEMLRYGSITQEEYDARKYELEEDYAEKEKEIRLEQWKRNKLLSSGEAVIEGALAVLKALNDKTIHSTTARIAMAAIISAATLAEIIKINTEPAPYAKGGYVEKRTVYQAGEAGREWVASNRLLNDPQTAPLIQALESYQRGNVRALGDIPMAQLNMPVVTAAARELGRRATTSPVTHAAAATRGDDMLSVMRELAKYLEDPRNRQAVISRQTMTDFDNNENFLRNHARLG